jgi:ketosteroid isomerase-like protein
MVLFPDLKRPPFLAQRGAYPLASGWTKITAPGPKGQREREMNTAKMSHQTNPGAHAHDLPGAAGTAQGAGASGKAGLSQQTEQTIRNWYAAWEKKDWRPLDALLADDFTFTSAAGDDHISKTAFKAQCWETQIGFIDRFDLLGVFGSGNEALVLYACLTRNGKVFRNVEYVRLKDGKLEAIECYFGEQSSYPSAVSAKPS